MKKNNEEIKKFSLAIENFRKQKKLSYLDAIILYCETNDIDIDSVTKLLSNNIKTALRFEAEELHFLKTKSRRLPIDG